MRISTRGRYAVRAMIDLAQHAGEGPIPRAVLSRRQGISAAYIAQLFRRLGQAGLVRGRKGPGGGYLLGRPPADISIGEIIRAVEGPIALVDCAIPGSGSSCPRAEGCAARGLWQQVSSTLAQALDGVTLQDLCADQKEVGNGPNL